MRQVGIWRIDDGGPRRVVASAIPLEQQLEGWIESDPSLLESGLMVVGRQVGTKAGTLDLLAIDPQGRWVVIELKRGAVYRETLSQALDYAACVAAMPGEELREVTTAYLRRNPRKDTPESAVEELAEGGEEDRELRICVVGTSRDTNLDRLVGFLSGQYGIPITVVTFEVYKLDDGDRILVRQLAESETAVLERRDTKPLTIDELCDRAGVRGIGPQFRSIVDAAQRNRLYVRPWKKCVMVAPPLNRARSLFSVWTSPLEGGETSVWLGPEVFAQFYPPLTEADVTAHLGEGGWREMTKEQVSEFTAGLDRLFATLQRPSLADLAKIADSDGPGANEAAKELASAADQAHIPHMEIETWAEVVEILEKPGSTEPEDRKK